MKINEIYSNYYGSLKKFEDFHNEVINMPRDHFSFHKLKQLRCIAAYLLLIKDKLSSTGNNYKQILGFLIDNIRDNKYPDPKFRDDEFEKNYLITNKPLEKIYKDKNKEDPENGGLGVGRMFRHIMELCEFFGLIFSLSKQKKVISIYKCEQMLLAEERDLIGLFRNYLINTNISTNTYIKNMFNVPETADYKPTISILKYIKAMNRPCTTFEIALLLGRIDNLYDNKSILNRAITIGKELPTLRDEQQNFIFNAMGWTDHNGQIYNYVASQQPEFKFNVYFICMEQLGLLKRNIESQTLILTDYANDLLNSSIPIEFSDLEKFAYSVEGSINEESDNELESELIDSLFKYDEEFKVKVLNDENFVILLNKHSLANPVVNQQGKKVRNKLVSEAAKILADYTDQVTGEHAFLDRKGNYYCEAHHIIEFSTEEGPDITDNLVVLNPNNHTCIHRGSFENVKIIYERLKQNGVLSKERFLHIIQVYNCLTKTHLRILFEKQIINKEEHDDLLTYIA